MFFVIYLCSIFCFVLLFFLFFFFFFFSSRRRHTRCSRDWSSDVCSSDLEAAEEILLDVNQLAEGKKFMSVGAFEISDDSNLLAYITDDVGYRQYKLHVKDLRTGKVRSEERRVGKECRSRGSEEREDKRRQ